VEQRDLEDPVVLGGEPARELDQYRPAQDHGAAREPLADLVDLGRQTRAGSRQNPDESRAFAVENRRRLGAIARRAGGLLAATGVIAAIADYIGSPAFATTTASQHADHMAAFQVATTSLGGAKQGKPDPVFVPVVDKAVAAITRAPDSQGPLLVVGLALELENIAAETYVNNMSLLTDANAKKVTASIMGVEGQHVAILLAVQALLKAGAGAGITLPPPAAKLPAAAAAGSVGFPNAF
jgi:hypothetical protein